MSKLLRVLIVEDSEDDTALLLRELRRGGYEPLYERVENAEAMKAALARQGWDVVIADYSLPHFSALAALTLLQDSELDLPFIIVSGTVGEDVAVATMKAGAHDYLIKGKLARLIPAIERELREAQVRRERKLAQERLHDSEMRFRALIENSADAITLIGSDGTVLYESPASNRILGYAAEERLGRNSFELMHPDDLDYTTRLFSQLLQKPSENVMAQFQFRHKNGSWRWIEAVGANLLAEPSVQAIVVNYRDITERKQAEEELKQRAAQLALINDIGSQIAAMLELAGVLDRAARLVQESFGYHHVALFLVEGELARLKAVAGSYQTYFPPHHSQPLSQGIIGWVGGHGEKVVANDISAEPRYVSLIADQTITQAELCLPIKVTDRVVGILDIQSPRLNAFRENDIIAMETLTHQIAVAIENARLYEAMQKELAQRQRVEEELQDNIQQLDLAYQQAAIYAKELNEKIAESKQAEQALEEEQALLTQRVAERTAELSAANAELARAARVKDEFLASMSHELRTPLNAILGLVEVLQAQSRGPLNEDQLKFLRIIEESGRHLLALINDILDVAKIEAGKLALQPDSVSIEAVCQASLQFVKQAALKKRVSVSFEMNNPQMTIRADARRLKQILANLLSNAVKFTPEGGQVGLEIRGEPEQEVIRFVVWDTGLGIAPEHLPRLFQPFVQIDSSLSRQHEGTGLGLVLVSRLVELHGGSISVESDGVPGRGSRFTVSLPWQATGDRPQTAADRPRTADDRPQPIEAKPSVVCGQPSAVILLAEDNEANIQLLTDYLGGEGYRVIVARNGAEALDRAREEQPDLILMDVQMPGMDGLEAIGRLRTEAQLATVPIIALTALAMPGDRERCLTAGANDYVSKPVGLKELVGMIEVQRKQVKT